MRGIVNFANAIKVSYSIRRASGELHNISTVLHGKCALTLQREQKANGDLGGYRAYISGFPFPLSVYLDQIEPYLRWEKLIITPHKAT